MAEYCTAAYVAGRLGTRKATELSREDSTPTPDLVKITTRIQTASNKIDDALRVRYELPLTSEHSTIQEICFQFTRFSLYDGGRTMSDNAQKQFDQSVKDLDKLSRGVLILDETDQDVGSSFVKTNATRVNNETIFSKTLLDRYPF